MIAKHFKCFCAGIATISSLILFVLVLAARFDGRGVIMSGYLKTNTKAETIHTKAETIHIALCVDSTTIVGVPALIESIKVHNQNNEIVIHIVVHSSNSIREFKSKLECTIILSQNYIKIVFHAFKLPLNLKRLIKVRLKRTSYLAKESNFIRFFFSKIFPSLSHVLYIDTDTLVLHDLSTLWTEVTNNEKLLLAVPRLYNIKDHFGFLHIDKQFHKRYGKNYKNPKYDFNAGVVGYNLKKWRKNHVFDEVKYWMKQNYKHSLWGFGTQPIMNLISYDDWRKTDERWNVHVPYRKNQVPEKFRLPFLIHWNGPSSKPWDKAKKPNPDPVTSLWMKYHKQECSGRGYCQHNRIGGSLCECQAEFEGRVCEKQLIFNESLY